MSRRDALRTLRIADGPTDLSLKNIGHADEAQLADLIELLGRHSELRLTASSVTPDSKLRPGTLGDDLALTEDMIEIRIPNLAERSGGLAEIFQHLVRLAVRSLDADMPEIPIARSLGLPRNILYDRFARYGTSAKVFR